MSCWPSTQARQRSGQGRRTVATTRSPRPSAPPGGAFSTTPRFSCPRIRYGLPGGASPNWAASMSTSVPQTPVSRMRTSACPSSPEGSGTSLRTVRLWARPGTTVTARIGKSISSQKPTAQWEGGLALVLVGILRPGALDAIPRVARGAAHLVPTEPGVLPALLPLAPEVGLDVIELPAAISAVGLQSLFECRPELVVGAGARVRTRRVVLAPVLVLDRRVHGFRGALAGESAPASTHRSPDRPADPSAH